MMSDSPTRLVKINNFLSSYRFLLFQFFPSFLLPESGTGSALSATPSGDISVFFRVFMTFWAMCFGSLATAAFADFVLHVRGMRANE
jgi:hypothetical protein